jgi:hypothetical protein
MHCLLELPDTAFTQSVYMSLYLAHFPYFEKNKRRLMRSVYLLHPINFRMPEPNFIKTLYVYHST